MVWTKAHVTWKHTKLLSIPLALQRSVGNRWIVGLLSLGKNPISVQSRLLIVDTG